MIKVTLGAVSPQTEKPFPKLMIGEDNSIIEVLETPDKYGFAKAIVRVAGYQIGPIGYRHSFNILNIKHHGVRFTDYNEPITIQNA